jgi:hypothetical protein
MFKRFSVALSLVFVLGCQQEPKAVVPSDPNPQEISTELQETGNESTSVSNVETESVNPVASFQKIVGGVPAALNDNWWRLMEGAGSDDDKNGVHITEFSSGSGKLIQRVHFENHDYDFASSSGWISVSGDETYTNGFRYYYFLCKCTIYFDDGKWNIMKIEYGRGDQGKPKETVAMSVSNRSDLRQFFNNLIEIKDQ